LDIKVVDKDGRIFDIEMQTSPSKYLGHRLRYYQSTIDGAKVLKPGHDYSELPDTFIILLCSFDPSEAFSRVDNRAVHFFKTIDTKDHALELNGGATKVIINSKGDFTGESEELKELAKLMNNEEVSLNEHFIWVQKRIKELNQDRRSDIMDYEMKIMDARISGREDGEKVGEKRGKEIGEKIGKEAERRAGIKRLIIAMMEISTDDRIIFNAAKKQYGEYFSDGELKQFIAEAKNDSLQEA
ncbi:Rpn family recombination-promoting nuclease/putative transposase, partial [Lactobacillus gigeriorum]